MLDFGMSAEDFRARHFERQPRHLLQLDSLSAQLVALLSKLDTATLAELERHVPAAGGDAIRRSLMNLSRYELVTLDCCFDN